MRKIGTFEIEESFNITGRGIVIVGYCSDLVPKPGMFVSVFIKEKIEAFKITGIQLGNKPKNDQSQFTLMIETTHALMKYITENKITNQIADVSVD